LVDNLGRLNEEEEVDRQGLFHVLGWFIPFALPTDLPQRYPGIFENIIGLNPSLSSNLVSKTNILQWVFTRIQSKIHDENRSYSAEILSIFLQNSAQNKRALGEKNGVEILLKVLSVCSLPLPLFFHLNILSNIVGGILSMRMKPNLWTIYSTPFVRL
jgi:beta-catenin-like protein 1